MSDLQRSVTSKTSVATQKLFRNAVGMLLVVGLFLCCSLNSYAQNIQRPNATSDFTKRSDLKIDPATLGLNIQIPLGNYPGRAGADIPITLTYSSKLYQIRFRQAPTEYDFYSVWLEPWWSDNAVAGWNHTLGVPRASAGSELYDSYGTPTTTCWPGCMLVRRVMVIMPDGSSHELRHGNALANWPSGQAAPSFSGLYYAVDGSQLRYDYDSKTLFLPDGSRYILGEQNPTVFLDRNGNKQTYNPQNLTWTDTLGRVIPAPFANYYQAPFTPGDFAYTLPGVGGTSLTYTFRWKLLSNARSDPSQPLLPLCSDTDPNNPGANYPGPWLFYTGYPDSVACGDGSPFNPLVLAELILPNGQSYKFGYNVYGEIDKLVYPSGGYERYRYEHIEAADWMRGVYSQANRGVVERWISPKGDGSDELQHHWTYSAGYGPNFSQPYKVTITSPDNTRTERLLHTGAENYPFGFRDVRTSRAYEERSYSATNQLLRRTLTKWTAANQYQYANARDPHLDKQVEIVFDTSSNALSQVTTNVYDQAQNVTSTSKYDFFELNPTTAQSIGVDSVPFGNFLRRDETIYLTCDPAFSTATQTEYGNRNLITLPTEKKVFGPSGMVAQSLLRYDEYSFVYSGSTGYWQDPGTSVRGNLTTSSDWLNTNGSYLSVHAQYDQYGNVRKNFDARDPGLLNPTQTDYSSASQFAYPTTRTSSVPDWTAIHGSNVSLVTTTVYDFNTGLVLSSTDANNQTTTHTYNDPLNRVKTIAYPDGGLVTYTYNDVPGSFFVATANKLTTTQESTFYQFYDGLGRSNRTFLFVGGSSFITQDTQFDNMGRQWRVSNTYFSNGSASAVNPSGQWTTTTYDGLGRVKTVTSPDNAVLRTDYDGNRTLVIDEAGKQRLSMSNALGQMIEVWEITPADVFTEAIPSFLNHPEVVTGYKTSYTYDGLGNLSGVTQPNLTSGIPQTRSFYYNSLSQLTDATNPESGHATYDYDANGNLWHRTDARGITTTYAYDALNRNISVVTSNDPTNTPTVNRYYDGFRDGNDNPSLANRKGRLWQTETSGTEASRTTINNTDAAGRITSVTQQFFSGTWSQPFTTQRTYNFAGEVMSQTYPSGRTVNYTVDVAGRIASFVGNLGDGVQRTYGSNLSYDDSGRLKEEQFGTQIPLYRKLHYNVRGQLYDMRLSTYSMVQNEWDWNRGAVVNYFSSNYAFGGSGTDNNGNVTRSTHFIPINDQLLPFVAYQHTYSYDHLNRLSSVTEHSYTDWSGQTSYQFSQAYTYDRFGNRTINQGGTSSTVPHPNYTADASTNRLIAPAGYSYGYDNAGNQTYDNYTGQGTPNRTFDANNRLTIVKDANQNVVGTYTYDGDGQRVRRKVSGVETWQIYGVDGALLAEYRSGSAPITATKEYGYRNGELLVTVTSGDVQRLQRFVKNLYYNALAREATPTELQQKMNTLAAAGVQGEAQLLTSARAISRALFESAEYIARGRTDVQYVTDLYNSYLQRGPDPGGLNWWVTNTQNNGRGATLNAFEVCSEFATLASTVYGTASGGENQRVEHFVWQFYLGALQREPTSTEMQQQTARLNNAAAQGQSQVITEAQTMGGEIFVATNYNSNRTTEEYVTDLYVAFLQRTPDGPGLGFWVGQTQAYGRANTLNAFKVSGEYIDLAGTLYREAFWLVGDHLNNARMIVDKSGNRASMKRHDYLPFGEELGLVSGRNPSQGYSQDSVRQKFTSKERDAETNLDYFLARYYSSAQGRFISPDEFKGGPEELFAEVDPHDPVFYADTGEPQSLNKYHYALNNPLRYVDPDGHQSAASDALKIGIAIEVIVPHPVGKIAGAVIIIGAGGVIVYENREQIKQGVKSFAKAVGESGAMSCPGISDCPLTQAEIDRATLNKLKDSEGGAQGSSNQNQNQNQASTQQPNKPNEKPPKKRENKRPAKDRSTEGTRVQRENIEQAQKVNRKAGKPDRIRSIEKSKQDEKNALKKIKKLSDTNQQ